MRREAIKALNELAGSEEEGKILLCDLYKYSFDKSESPSNDVAINNMKDFFQTYPPKYTSNGRQHAQILTKGFPVKLAEEITTYDRGTLRKTKFIGPKQPSLNKRAGRELISSFLDDSKRPLKISELTQTQAFPFSKKYEK